MMTSQHPSWPRGPLEAALLEFRGKEKQWTVEKALLRREADAQSRQAGKLQHQLDKMQVSRCTSHKSSASPQSFQQLFPAHVSACMEGCHWSRLCRTLPTSQACMVCKWAQFTVSKHWFSPLTMLAGAAKVHHAGAVQCESGLEEA